MEHQNRSLRLRCTGCDQISWTTEEFWNEHLACMICGSGFQRISDGSGPRSLFESTPFVRMTKKIVNAGMSAAGGWSKKQLTLIGVSWPPLKGWKDRLVGKYLKREDVEEFLRLKKELINEDLLH